MRARWAPTAPRGLRKAPEALPSSFNVFRRGRFSCRFFCDNDLTVRATATILARRPNHLDQDARSLLAYRAKVEAPT